MEVCAPVSADQSSIFSLKHGETSAPGCHESFGAPCESVPSENSKFTIRGFVASVRRKDIRKTWPFSEPLLEQFIVEGKSLPNLDSPPGNEDSSLRSQETALTTVATDAATHGCNGSDETGFGNKQQQQSGDLVPVSGAPSEQDNILRTACTAAVAAPAVVDSDSEGRGEVQNGDSLEDKGSDTGVVDPEPEEPKALGGESRGEDVAACPDHDHHHQQHKQKASETQRVCPICSNFSCHSVNTINAHIDGCLNNPAGTHACEKTPQRARSSKGFKKMRSITDIIASDPSPASKADPKLPEDTTASLREKRAPSANHVVLADDHDLQEVHKPQQQQQESQAQQLLQQQQQSAHQRQLRSRSRGSRSMATRLDAATTAAVERPTRSRLRKSSGEWSQDVQATAATRLMRNRHCSGNSVEVTSSWTPSISSGTYSHCKAKDIQVQEKSCAEEKPSESHGSAGPSTSLQPIQEDESSPISSKEPEAMEMENAENTSSNKPETGDDKPEDLSARKDDGAAGDQASKNETTLEEATRSATEEQEAAAGDKRSEPESQPAEPMEIVDTSQVIAETEAAPAAGTGTSAQPESPPQQVHAPSPPLAPAPSPAVIHHHPLRQAIPVYESMISSLRSGTPVDSLTGQNNFNPTWKAAVVMATLGATPRRSSTTRTSGSPAALGARPAEVMAHKFVPPPSNTAAVSSADPVTKTTAVQSSLVARALGEATASKDSGPAAYQQVFFSGVQGVQGSSAYQNQFNVLAEGLHQQLYPGQRVRFGPASTNAGGETRAVIVDAPESMSGSRAQGGDRSGRPGEKPVFKLMGQTVTPAGAQKQKEILLSGNSCSRPFPYGYNASGCHQSAARPGFCCCGSSHLQSHSLGKDPLPGSYGSGGFGSIPQMPALGNVRYASVPVPGAKFHTHQQQRPEPQQQQEHAANKSQASNPSEQLPPWLLEAKKQKEAEVAASTVIVIDDDDSEEHKGDAPRNRSDRPHHNNINSNNKREAGDHWNLSGEKAIKLSSSDSPASTSRVVYVPMMVTENHHHAAGASSSTANNIMNNSSSLGISSSQLQAPSGSGKRGATAQAYKARIAMWKALMSNGTEQHQHQQLSQSRLAPGSYANYQHASQLPAGSSSNRVFSGQGFPAECSASAIHQNNLLQQQLNLSQLILTGNYRVVSVDGAPCLLLDPQTLMEPAAAAGAIGSSSHQHHHHHVQAHGDHQHGGGGSFGRNIIVCNGAGSDLAGAMAGAGVGAGAGAGQQPVVMAPVVAQHPAGLNGMNFVLAPAAGAGGAHQQQLVQVLPLASVVQHPAQLPQQQQHQIHLQNHHQVRSTRPNAAWQLQLNKNV